MTVKLCMTYTTLLLQTKGVMFPPVCLVTWAEKEAIPIWGGAGEKRRIPDFCFNRFH